MYIERCSCSTDIYNFQLYNTCSSLPSQGFKLRPKSVLEIPKIWCQWYWLSCKSILTNIQKICFFSGFIAETLTAGRGGGVWKLCASPLAIHSGCSEGHCDAWLVEYSLHLAFWSNYSSGQKAVYVDNYFDCGCPAKHQVRQKKRG